MNAPTPDPTQYDPFAAEVMANPLPYYKALRAKTPRLYLQKYDTWVFTKFQDIMDVLAIGDNTFIASESTLPNRKNLLRHNDGQVAEHDLAFIPNGALLGSPHYEILRQAHIKPFRPRYVADLEAMTRELCNQRLDLLLPKRTFDLTQDYGGIVAASMMCHLFDMPLSLAPEVLETVNELSLTDPEVGGKDVAVVVGRCLEIMRPHIARRRAAGADGSVPLIDGLIQLDYYKRPLTDDEIGYQLTCALVGGTETGPKIAAHGLMELSRHPDQLAAVRGDLEKNVPLVVEEMIRYCGPAQWFARTAHKDVTVAGCDIKKGQRIMAVFASAARDEDEYEDPDAFIWNRDNKRLLGFGYGQHYCIGVHLARMELRVFVREFLKRVPEFSFDMEHAVRLPSSFQWGWNRLPVIIGRPN